MRRYLCLAAIVVVAAVMGSADASNAPSSPAHASGLTGVRGRGAAALVASWRGPRSRFHESVAVDQDASASPAVFTGADAFIAPQVSPLHEPSAVAATEFRALRTSAPSIGLKLNGLSSATNPYNPADVQVASGAGFVIEMVNSSLEVWSSEGVARKLKTQQLGDFFSTSVTDRRADAISDPRIVFDAVAGRWFAAAMNVSRGELDLAVSQGGDPTSSWWVYTLPSHGCPDQPRLGLSDNLLVIADNLHAACSDRGSPFIGAEVTVITKQPLLAGSAYQYNRYGPSSRYSEITPVISLSSTGVQYLVSTDWLFDRVVLYTVSDVQQSFVPVTLIPVRSLEFPPSSPQLGTGVTIDTTTNRVQNAIWKNASLWLSFNQGCLISGESGEHSCGRYISVSTDTNQVTNDVTVALDRDRNLFYPAAALDSGGHLISVFGFASPSEPPGVGAVIDPGSNTGWNFIQQGSASNSSGRWGDYFGAATDPTHPEHVWVAGQYGQGAGEEWGTTVAAIGLTPFTIATPPAAPAHPKPKKHPKKKHR